MATLTYDPTPADQPEFSDEELDSLKVGEEMEQSEQQLLAGKYKDAEELEKAYIELQKKLGGGEEETDKCAIGGKFPKMQQMIDRKCWLQF